MTLLVVTGGGTIRVVVTTPEFPPVPLPVAVVVTLPGGVVVRPDCVRTPDPVEDVSEARLVVRPDCVRIPEPVDDEEEDELLDAAEVDELEEDAREADELEEDAREADELEDAREVDSLFDVLELEVRLVLIPDWERLAELELELTVTTVVERLVG